MPAKTPEIREFFKLTIELPPALLGDVMTDLAKRGITEIHHELVTETVKFKTNKQNGGPILTDMLEAWMTEHPTFTSKEAVIFARENGRGNAGVYYALNKLIERGVLKRLDGTNYARADVKAIEGPKLWGGAPARAAKPKPAKKAERDHFEVNHREFILRHMRRSHGVVTYKTLQKHFEEDGRKLTSISGAIGSLIENKQIKSDGEGKYTLLVKGSAKPVKKTESKPKPAVVNNTEVMMGDETNG